jgi:hypothetical protein
MLSARIPMPVLALWGHAELEHGECQRILIDWQKWLRVVSVKVGLE